MNMVAPLTFWQRVATSPDDFRPYGMLMFIVAAVLLLIWLFLVFKRRRPYKLYCACIIILTAFGYLAFDLRHISLNLRMRDAQRVREDCIELMQRREAFVEEDYMGIHLRTDHLPPSFARMGTKKVDVSKEFVTISFIEGGWGSEWGFVYFPRPDEKIKKLRSTGYRDFYEYFYHGE